ncbi:MULTISPECIES: nuclease-related domain-containing protein [Protofrankia]|uniref:NERD domain protein n=1 Tax=Candidatus Protofrankia datiscae TaxID=2716812 RepID=F8B049_9ACTN|nr:MULTISPECIES: nuclease-related domain-containing protein [Protofrankia]AEH11748.1 NERD domain protein [Candidatus Protofrankia datiscae]
MAEYLRRRELYVAERKDRLARAVVTAAVVAALTVAAVSVFGAVVGLSALVVLQMVLGAVLVVLAVAAARFLRSPSEIESWRHDAEAERRTARALDRLVRAGYTVLHDRALADSAGNVDHLVIGPSGVWVVETDAHRGPLRQNRAGLWAGKMPLRAMLGLVAWMGEEVTSHLVADLPEGWQLQAQPVVAFSRAELPHGLALLDGVVLLPAAGVADYILTAGVVLKPLDVAILVDVAERALPPYPVDGPAPTWPAMSRLRGILGR